MRDQHHDSAGPHAARTPAFRCALAALPALAIAAVAAFAAPPKPKTVLVSVNAAGTAAVGRNSNNPSISSDGRFVVWQSDAPDHFPGDTNGTADVFLRDLRTRTTTPVSVASSGNGSGDDRSDCATVSKNGRFVAFQSRAKNLVAATVSGAGDVYVRDMKSGVTTLVSVNAAGTGAGNAASLSPRISADGRFVAFASAATDMVSLATGGNTQVYVRDLRRGTTTLVSVGFDGSAAGNGNVTGNTFYAKALSISRDGRFVAFCSDATNLATEWVPGLGDVYVRDLRKRTTALASVSTSGPDPIGGNAESFDPALSADGRWVSFESRATDLTATPLAGNGSAVQVRDLKRRTTTTASLTADGTAAPPNGAYTASISANGRFVAFSSDSDGLVPDDSNGSTDVFLRDLRRRTTTLVSRNAAGTGSGDQFAEYSEISADGRFVAFYGYAGDLVTNDGNQAADVFVRDVR